MKTVLSDLHLYELVLLFLGIFLFLILSSGLLYYIIKKEEIKKLLFFFPIPILMIGYPSIKEITISSDKIALSKYQEEYIKNPEDTIVKQKLEALTEKLEERAETPADIISISKTKLLLGNSEGAIKYANKAIKIEEKEKMSEKVSDSDTRADEEDSDTAVTKEGIYTQARQLKQLAQIQHAAPTESDTTRLKAKINNIYVSKELKGTRKLVSRNALLKARKAN